MKIIKIDDAAYPEQLRKIDKPPQKIYVVGNEKILNEKSIAIVGSRNCTEYGKMQSRKFSEDLTKQGLVITSGMAIGIDTNAHIGCISSNGKTIAVLGCGFNKLYPKENAELFKKIIDTGGAIISEYAPYVEPSPDKFRLRNRIISGLTIATLVIEAKYRSGTMITARMAKKQGKQLFYIKNDVTNELLKNEAILVTNANELIKKCNIKNDKYYINN